MLVIHNHNWNTIHDLPEFGLIQLAYVSDLLSLYPTYDLPYSRKYWRELNLVVEPKITIERILADLNLAVRYGIAIRIYVSRKFWRILIWKLTILTANCKPLVDQS